MLITVNSLNNYGQQKLKIVDKLFQYNSAIYLGKSSETISKIAIDSNSAHKLIYSFLPFKVNFFAKDIRIDNDSIKIDSVFFNIDSIAKVSAILFKLKVEKSNLLEEIFSSDYGKLINRVYSPIGNSRSFIRSLNTKQFNIIITDYNNEYNTIVIFNGEPKKLLLFVK